MVCFYRSLDDDLSRVRQLNPRTSALDSRFEKLIVADLRFQVNQGSSDRLRIHQRLPNATMNSIKPSRLSLDNLGQYPSDVAASPMSAGILGDCCQQRRGRFKMLHTVQSLPNIAWTRYSGSFSSDSGTESVMDTLPEVESTVSWNSSEAAAAPGEDKENSTFTTLGGKEILSQQEAISTPPPVRHEGMWKQVTFSDQDIELPTRPLRRSRRASAKATGTNSGSSSPTVRHKLINSNKRLSCPTDTSSSIILAFNNGATAADVDVVPVQLDMTVGEAVQEAVERRGLTLDSVDLFLALSARPVSLAADVTTVCGRRIVVRVRRCTASPEETEEPQPPQDFTMIPALTIIPPPDNFTDDKEEMFIKRRDQVASSLATTESPATMHRRYSHRPRNADVIHPRGEPHPSVVQNFGCMPSISDPFPAIDEKTKRYDDEVIDSSSNDVTDSAQYSTWPSTDSQKSRALKALNFLNPFVGKDKLEALQACLAAYSSPGGCGLPSATPYFTSGKPKLDPGKIELDKHWSHLVTNAQALSKRECEQQEAIWELLETEVKYIRNVTVIINLFLACLGDLQRLQILSEIDLRAIFVNICDILNVNCTLWKSYLSKVVDYSKRTGDKLNPSLLREAFCKFDTMFEPYTEFCSAQSASLRYIHDRLEDNELFRTFVAWAESQPQCNRLKLPDLIIMPMQRLTKYRLLLQAILKKTDSLDDKRDLNDMITTVDRFMCELNVYLQQKENTDKMRNALEKIESYEAIDPINDECAQLLSDFCQLDLSRPIPGCSSEVKRNLLLEGTLKMKDGSSKMDVQCFLFTDVLLITKPSRRYGNDKVKVIRPPMRLDSVIVWSLRDNGGLLVVHVSDYGVAIATYLLTGDVTPWLDNIRKAQESFRTLKAISEREELHSDDSSDESEQQLTITNGIDSKKKGAKQGQDRVRISRHRKTGLDNNAQLSSDDNADRNVWLQECQSVTIVEGASNLDLVGSRPNGQASSEHISSTSGGLTDHSDDILLEDESLRGKHKERRSSRTEKRYLTADAIKDLAKEASKQTGIHKRFSWNSSSDSTTRNQLGTTNDVLINTASSLLTRREKNSESTESVNSSLLSSSRSSGVSSTMSFHAPSENDESEISVYNRLTRNASAKFAFDESSLTFDSDSCLTESESPGPASKQTLSILGNNSIKSTKQRRTRNQDNAGANLVVS